MYIEDCWCRNCNFWLTGHIWNWGSNQDETLNSVCCFGSQKRWQAQQPRWEIRHKTLLSCECEPCPTPHRSRRLVGLLPSSWHHPQVSFGSNQGQNESTFWMSSLKIGLLEGTINKRTWLPKLMPPVRPVQTQTMHSCQKDYPPTTSFSWVACSSRLTSLARSNDISHIFTHWWHKSQSKIILTSSQS